jgi:hypothetical protein
VINVFAQVIVTVTYLRFANTHPVLHALLDLSALDIHVMPEGFMNEKVVAKKLTMLKI